MRSTAAVLGAVVGLCAAIPQSRGLADTGPGSGRPKVVLIGDSIRLGYAPRAAARLQGKADVVSSSENELGNVFTEVLSGTPHHYLKQAGFPRGSLAVAVRAVFLADQFDITTFFRGQRDGYELISRSEPTVRHFFQGTREGPRARFTESAYVETWLRADLVEEGALA